MDGYRHLCWLQQKMSSQRALNHVSQTKIVPIPGKLGGLVFQIVGLVGQPLSAWPRSWASPKVSCR